MEKKENKQGRHSAQGAKEDEQSPSILQGKEIQPQKRKFESQKRLIEVEENL